MAQLIQNVAGFDSHLSTAGHNDIVIRAVTAAKRRHAGANSKLTGMQGALQL